MFSNILLTPVFTEQVSVKIEPAFKLSLIELNTFSKLLIGVAIITKSEFFTASPALLNISSESLSFSMISFTDLLLSKVIIF